MARLNAVGHNRNISISLPQKMIDQLEAQLRGKSMKRSHWVGDAINRKLRDTDPELFADRSLHQIMLHLICRRDFSDLESVRLDELYEKDVWSSAGWSKKWARVATCWRDIGNSR